MWLFLCNKMQRILDSGTVPSDPNQVTSVTRDRSILRLSQGDGSSVRKTGVFHTDEPSPKQPPDGGSWHYSLAALTDLTQDQLVMSQLQQEVRRLPVTQIHYFLGVGKHPPCGYGAMR